MTNYEVFLQKLTSEYVYRFKTDSEYAYSAAHITPAALAERMIAGLMTGGANKDGAAIKTVCKALGIQHTYKAIKAFLKGDN